MYRPKEDFVKLKAIMPDNYPLVNPDPDIVKTPEDVTNLIIYGQENDAFIPVGAYEDAMSDKRFVIIMTMVGHEYFQVEIPKY